MPTYVSKNKDKVYIKTAVTTEEKAWLDEQAKSKHISMNKYTHTRLLDTTKGVKELKEELDRSMPAFYAMLQRLDDKTLKKELMEWGGQLWQSLK